MPQMDSEEILGSLGDFTQVVTVAAPTWEASNITVELLKYSSRSIIEDHPAVDTYVDIKLWRAISAVIVFIPRMDLEEILGSLGFLSINCGIAEDLNYTDAKTKIFYTSDARFIDTGTNKQISKDYKFQTLPRQYQNVRFFPDGSRNCDTLSPVVKGSRYLVRASFMYGNYDGLNMLPQFDAYENEEVGSISNRKKKDGSLRLENRQFTYAEIISITDNFERIIGKGGFGVVYHGYAKDSTQVAVKMLSQSSSQRSKEFQTEASVLCEAKVLSLNKIRGLDLTTGGKVYC
ncbi:hypothetical protein AAC387_Pa03g4453 [Persea americana]